jgi:hypothetical protein
MSRTVLVRLAEHELRRPSALRAFLSDSTPAELEWLRKFGAGNGVLSEGELHTDIGGDSAVALRRLAARGLVVPGPFNADPPVNSYDVNSPQAPLWCPYWVIAAIRGDKIAHEYIAYKGEVAIEKTGDFRTFEQDLMTLADHLSRGTVRRRKSGFPGKRFLAHIAKAIGLSGEQFDAERFETNTRLLFLYDLLDDLGGLAVRHERVSTSHMVDAFFAKPAAERIDAYLESWQQITRYNEMYRIPELSYARQSPEYDAGDGRTDDMPTAERLLAAREFLLGLASRFPAGCWLRLSDVIEAAYEADDAFLIGSPKGYTYAHAPLYRGINSVDGDKDAAIWWTGIERAGNWNQVEGRFIRELFAGSLADIGLFDVGSASDGTQLIRMNRLGAWLLANDECPDLSVPKNSALIVQPDFEIIVFPEGRDVSIVWPLIQATETVSSDRALTLKLTADGMRHAAQRGMNGATFVQFLETYSRAQLPPNVRQAISDWNRRNLQVTITKYVDLVEGDTPDEFARFIQSVNSDKIAVRQLSDTIGVVSIRLAKAGPMSAFDYQGKLPPTLIVDDNLGITVQTARENWGTRTSLGGIAEQVGTNTFEITRRSAFAALDFGITHEHAHAFLQSVATTPLSARALFKLRSLFASVAPVALADALLLQFANETDLTAAMAVEDFRACLLQRVGPTTAVVNSEKAADLRALLHDFGIATNAPYIREAKLPSKPLGEVRKPPGDER